MLCPTNFLPDEPVEQDEFGSHERVADALYKTVMEGEGGKAIALVGSWGSGKSTVIKILEGKVKCRENLAVFVFDTWAHQGDPLRRSFLERLSEFLKERGWIGNETYNEVKEKLAQRKETVTTKTNPVLTGWGKVLVFFLILLPLGSALVNVEGRGFWKWVGFAILGIPSAIVFVSWIWSWLIRRSKDEKSKPEDLEALYLQKMQEIQHSTAIRTPDPTSVEFLEMFVKVLKEGLEEKERRLVIVMDNLDRLNTDEARGIWATMRTFFELDREAEWRKRVWLIVPHDPSILKRLWSSDEEEEDELPNAFASKTFQITFHVPPPVLSDWDKFLEKCLKEAFPQHENDVELNIVKRLFRFRPKKVSRSLTPRDIKQFVNRVCALHQQWCGTIPLGFQALYVLFEGEIDEEKLISGELPNPKILDLLGEKRDEWQKFLAALHFNVHPNKALHVLIGNEVREALISGDGERLKRLSNVPGFIEVVEDILDKMDLKEQPDQIGKASLALVSVENVPTNIFQFLSEIVFQVSGNWDTLDERSCEGLVLLSERLDEGNGKKLVSHLLVSLSETKPPKEATDNWVRGVLKILMRAKELGLEGELDSFRVNGDATDYFMVLEAFTRIGGEDLTLIRYFIPKVSEREVLQELSSKIDSGKMDRLGDIVYCLLAVPNFSGLGAGEWQGVVEAVRGKLHSEGTKPEEVKELLKSLIAFVDSPNTSSVFQNLLNSMVSGGQIFHHLYQAHSNQKFDTVAWCVIALLEGQLPPSYSQYYWGNAQSGSNLFWNDILEQPRNHPQILEEFVSICLQRIRQRKEYFSQLVKLGSDNVTGERMMISRWVKETLSMAIERELDDFFPLESVVSHYSDLKTLFSSPDLLPQLGKLIRRLTERRGLAAEIIQTKFDPQISDLYLLILDSCPEEHISGYQEFLKKGLQSLNKEEWLSHLTNSTLTFKLFLNLVKRGEQLNMGQAFFDALLEHAEKVLTGEIKVSEELERKWKYVPGALNPDLVSVFGRDLRDLLLEKSDQVNTTAPFLRLYGELLKSDSRIEEEGDKLFRKVFRRFLERKNREEIEWMAKVIEDTDVLEQTEKDAVKEFLSRAEGLLREEGVFKEVKEVVEKVIKIIRTRKASNRSDSS